MGIEVTLASGEQACHLSSRSVCLELYSRGNRNDAKLDSTPIGPKPRATPEGICGGIEGTRERTRDYTILFWSTTGGISDKHGDVSTY